MKSEKKRGKRKEKSAHNLKQERVGVSFVIPVSGFERQI